MAVPGDREGRARPIERARDDDRQLRREVELALGEERGAARAAECLPGVVEVGGVHDPDLAAPVVPADRQLEPERQAEVGGRSPSLRHGPDLAPRRHRDPGALHEPALGEPVLGDEQGPKPGPDGHHRRARLDHLGRDVLQLVGHDGTQAGQPPRRRDVVVRTDDDLVRDRRGRTLRIRVEDRDPVAHRPRRHGQHPTELAATEDPDDGGRRDRRGSIHGPSVGAYAWRMSDLPRHIVITGLMGAGKTTTGRALAEAARSDVARFGRRHRERQPAGPSASSATREGVDAMHAREAAQLLDALASPEPNVISAAASVVDDAACREAMAGPDVAVVWLHAAPAVLAARFDSADEHRPAYGAHPEVFLAAQAAQREPLARAIGAHIVDVDDLTEDRGRRAGARCSRLASRR